MIDDVRFDFLKNLEGTWVARAGSGEMPEGRYEFRVTAGGTAIEELEVASGDESIRIVMHRGSSMSSLVTTAATPVATVADAPRAAIVYEAGRI